MKKKKVLKGSRKRVTVPTAVTDLDPEVANRKHTLAQVQKDIEHVSSILEDPENVKPNQRTARIIRETEQEEKEKSEALLSPDDIAFIPDYDPKLTVEENMWIAENEPLLQARFLGSSVDEVLFAGGRGSGKSTAFIIDPLRYCNNGNFRGLIIRKAMPDLRDLITRCKALYQQAYPGVQWKANDKVFVFPSGARMEFGYCDSIDDLERYRGQEYTWIGIDEVAQYPGPWIIDRLKASMRSTDPTIPICLRCTCNPLGPGQAWVRKHWNIKHRVCLEEGPDLGKVTSTNSEEKQITTFKSPLGDLTISRTWFNSTVFDNKVLLASNPNYIASLMSHSNEAVKAQELYGCWDMVEGLAFPEFREDIHVVDDFEIPPNWYRWRAADYGYSSMGVCLWFATDWDNNVYVYRELATTLVNVEDWTHMIQNLEMHETVSRGYLDGSLRSKRGEVGESPEQTMSRLGIRWTMADRSPGSRKSSKLMVHKYLKPCPDTGRPKLRILKSCKELISELSTLQLDSNDPEDVDRSKKSSIPDHAYDALRYGVQAKPDSHVRAPSDPFLAAMVKQDDAWEPFDTELGL